MSYRVYVVIDGVEFGNDLEFGSNESAGRYGQELVELGSVSSFRVVEDTKSYYTVQQVMVKLHLADETIYRYIRSGKLKAIRLGGVWRVSDGALREFLQGDLANAAAEVGDK